MVSKHIRTLEERLGVRLLNRTTRRVNATEVGQNYYERCLRILAELEDAESAASDLQAAPRGLLRVTASVSYGARVLAPAIADFLAGYPDLSIDLNLHDHYVDLLEERTDLAIRAGRLSDSSLVARKLTAIEMVLCASPGYLEANSTPQKPRDLLKHNCLVYTYAAPRAWTFTDQAGKEEVIRISGRLTANSGDPLLALALRDTGIIYVPDYLAADDLREGRLVRLLPAYTMPDIPVHAVYPHSRLLSAKTRTLIDFLAARLTKPARHETSRRGNGSDRIQAPQLRAAV